MTDLWNPSIYKPFLIGIFLMFFQQFTGINAIMFYADMIFEEANFKVCGASRGTVIGIDHTKWLHDCTISQNIFQNSSLASVIVGLIQVVFTAVAALIMDRAGRKILLIISGIFTLFFYMEWFQYNPASVTSNENTALCKQYYCQKLVLFLLGGQQVLDSPPLRYTQ